MTSQEHDEIVKHIIQLDTIPKDPSKYANWISATGHLELLQNNAKEDELIIFATYPHTFIQAVVVSEHNLQNLERDALLKWSGNMSTPCAKYGTDKEGNSQIDYNTSLWDEALQINYKQLVFDRQHKVSGVEPYEILQEYSHLAGIHWNPEQHAYGYFNELAWEDIVSVTHDNDTPDLDLVTFKWQQLERYLVASNSVLIRTFEFTLYQSERPIDSSPKTETVHKDENLFYHDTTVDDKARRCRGVQIIRPSRSDHHS